MMKLYNLEGSSSDHSPLLLVPVLMQQQARQRLVFKFETSSLTDPICEQLVRERWQYSGGRGIQEKIQICREKLAMWGKKVTRNFGKRIKDCKYELKQLRNKFDIQEHVRYTEVRK